MKLSAFITTHMDEIVAEFVSFAQTLHPAAIDVSSLELLDHAREILSTIAADLDSDQTETETKEKSISQVSVLVGAATPASEHGAGRQASGFTLPQLTAEYRALRASVLRLWMPTIRSVTKSTADEMARFHEGIDQALQESAIQYSQKTDRARDTFLAILGHDLRSPLATMAMAGLFLTREGEGNERTAQIGARVKRSAAAMTTMVNDLLEFARTELGGKMPVDPVLADLRDICNEAVEEARVAHPDCRFALKSDGETLGDFDAPRLSQVFSNLLNNAAQYRSGKKPVTLSVKGGKSVMIVTVTNFGREIAPESLKSIFDPMVQLSVSTDQKGPAPTSLGLGLFIAREITVAHGGSINVDSGARSGTVFTVKLPRSIDLRGDRLRAR